DSDEQRRQLPGSLDTTTAGIKAAGARALAVPMDLHDHATLATSVDRVLGQWGRIDLLVNNAVDTGPGSMTRFLDTPLEAFAAKLDANVLAPVALIKLVLPGMLGRGAGTIVNVTSAVAITDPASPAGEGGWGSAYAMSKGAFHRLAAILAVELTDRGVLAFNVEPGYVVTEKMEINQRELGLEGRYPGAPPSVPASVIAWLATDAEAPTLNGQTISAQRFARERGLHPAWKR
ncbi:MAG: SDR family NAD(P)-dependent oxidoreductase, partial [Acidimicrobiia bacterium]